MRKLHIAVLTASLLAMAGCETLGIEKKHVDYKAADSQVPSLEVPPDLTRPETEDRYAIPAGNGESVESYSDYAKGNNGARGPGRAASTVLPLVQGAHLEHEGGQRWLAVDGSAENVWPQVKAFLQENGYHIKTENPQAGILETDWAENRANISQGGLRDRYLVRLERSKDGNGTNVYITHYGMQEVLAGSDKESSKWVPRPSDPELEAAMLQMLMAKLGSHGAAQAADPLAVEAQPMLQKLADGSSAVAINEPFDRCWRKVELALEQANIAVEDKDRASGMLYLRTQQQEKGMLDKLKFWKSEDEDKPARMQVQVHQDANGSCLVTAGVADGSSNADTERVVNAIYRGMSAQSAAAGGKSAAALPSVQPKLQQASSGTKTILLGESVERCWNDVQATLERAGLKAVDSDRTAGKFYLPASDRDADGSWFSRLAFWKSGDSIKMARPEVVLRAAGNGCEVSANDGSGAANDSTQHIIETLYQNMIK